MPIDSRTVPGPMSVQRRCSAVKPRGCCIAGATHQRLGRTEARGDAEELAAPRRSACRPRGRREVEGDQRAEVRPSALRASAWPDRRAGPDSAPAPPRGRAARNSATRSALRALRIPAQEIRLQAPQDQERGVRVERRTEVEKSSRSGSMSSRAADHRAAHHVAVAGRVLGQAVRVQVDVELAVVVQPAERVVEQRQRAVRAGERGDARRCPRP